MVRAGGVRHDRPRHRTVARYHTVDEPPGRHRSQSMTRNMSLDRHSTCNSP